MSRSLRKPNFFIVGAPKSGTTTLYRWLSEHPEIYMSPKKEPFYFDFDDRARSPLTLKQYEALFSGACEDHVIVGEASTRYLQSAIAVSEILKYSPGARFMVMLRNPVDMAYSLHGQAVLSGGEPVVDFKEAWDLQVVRSTGKSLPKDCREPRRFQYGEVCKVGDQLERLYSVVPKNRVHVVFLDDLRGNPGGEYLALLGFLGLSGDGRSDFPIYNSARRVRFYRLQRLMKIVGDIKIALGITWRPGLSRFNSETRRRPAMSAEMRSLLQLYFAEQIEKIESLTNRDLSVWRD